MYYYYYWLITRKCQLHPFPSFNTEAENMKISLSRLLTVTDAALPLVVPIRKKITQPPRLVKSDTGSYWVNGGETIRRNRRQQSTAAEVLYFLHHQPASTSLGQSVPTLASCTFQPSTDRSPVFHDEEQYTAGNTSLWVLWSRRLAVRRFADNKRWRSTTTKINSLSCPLLQKKRRWGQQAHDVSLLTE